MSTKTCSKCGVEKDVGEFNKNKSRKDGLQHQCKSCVNEHYKANRDERLAKVKEHYEANREEKLAYAKKYYEANREERIDYAKEHYEANREEICAKMRTPEARVKINSWFRKKRVEDPIFRIAHILRARVRHALKAQGAEKFTSTMDLIGCSPEFLSKRLEKQIKPETKREDYHVDHIIPCALFDLTKEEEQKMCFHWTNLQLLLGPTNISKSDDVIWCGQVYRPHEVPPEIREAIYAHCRSNII